MKKYFTLVIFTCSALSVHATCSLPAPTSFSSLNPASCQIDLKWNAVNTAVNYTIQYKLEASPTWLTLSNIGNVTTYTLAGLASGSSYNVRVAPICSDNSVGEFSTVLTFVTSTCSKPLNVLVTGVTISSATVSWTVPCGESNFTLKFKKASAPKWTTKKNIASTSYQLTGLEINTTYQVKVQSKCSGSNTSQFSLTNSFTTAGGVVTYSGKNVLLVIIDDARFDSYTANNGPSFFGDSNISRIADEGVNFKLGFPVQSQCAPSRASITTGVYPHLHGVLNNPQDNATDTITLPTLPEILHNHNYYCGLIGKYHISKWPQPGYDYWMEQHKVTYIDTKYNLNGHDRGIKGHQTDVITDSAMGFFKKVPPGKPFFLWLGYRAPHTPYTPRPVDSNLYKTDVMPFPSNPDPYTINYPGFIYDCHSAPDSQKLVEDYRGYFRLLHGVEDDLGKLYHLMDSIGVMDSTLIIFMSDNGYIMGENDLLEKQLAYENSIKIPIFMRYPKLITAGKIVKKQMAENIDIAPTILDFAGIPDTFGMQGISLLKLYNGSVKRTEMLYEFHHQDCVPDMRAVRSVNAKYIQYYCSDTTEEYYDLNNDKKEITNQIFNPAYADSVQLYRDKLAYWRNYYADYTWDSLYVCSLTNIQQRSLQHNQGVLTLMNVFPNPAHNHVTIHLISAEAGATTITIFNEIGRVMYAEEVSESESEFSREVSVANFAPGNYYTLIRHGSTNYTRAFIVQ